MKAVLFLLALVPCLALGQVYKTVDKDGNVSFSDTPQGKRSEPVEIRESAPGSPARSYGARASNYNAPSSTSQTAEKLRRARLAREAQQQYANSARQDSGESFGCKWEKDQLALYQSQWERKARRGYRQSEKIAYENRIADAQLRVQQDCN